jgi:hypothetical protein
LSNGEIRTILGVVDLLLQLVAAGALEPRHPIIELPMTIVLALAQAAADAAIQSRLRHDSVGAAAALPENAAQHPGGIVLLLQHRLSIAEPIGIDGIDRSTVGLALHSQYSSGDFDVSPIGTRR